MRWSALAAVALLALGGSGCRAPVRAPAGLPALGPVPGVLRIQTGQAGQTGKGRAAARVDITDFLPTAVTARPGDILRFVNPTLGTPHTVTFGLSDQRATWPAALLAGARPNPVRLAPCVAAAPPGPAATDCPTPEPATSPAGVLVEPFAGQGFYNAGVVRPGASLDLHLGATLPPGGYVFHCLIHAGMDLSVRVVLPSALVPGQATLDRQARAQVLADEASARLPVSPADNGSGSSADGGSSGGGSGSSRGGGSSAGVAVAFSLGGWGRGSTVDQVAPVAVRIPAGGLVTWRNYGPDPHTVAFGSNGGPDGGLLLAPASVAEQATYAGGFGYSGWIGAGVGRPTFSLHFPQPGRYPFRCTFHPGMTGVVIVG